MVGAMPEQLIRIIAKTRGPGNCRSCGAMITWARTFPRNQAMPFDGDPIALKTEHDQQEGLIEFIPASQSHFANCPQSKLWSGKGRK
jgi:hypothetical protein